MTPKEIRANFVVVGTKTALCLVDSTLYWVDNPDELLWTNATVEPKKGKKR